MNWDEQLIKACTETNGTPHPHTDHVLTGAKWMREQLRTDEAIEKAAEVMFEADWEDDDDFEQVGRPTFANLHKEGRDYYRERADRAITALLGDN